MLNNKLINELSSKYAEDTSLTECDRQIAFIKAQSVFCWFFKRYNIE